MIQDIDHYCSDTVVRFHRCLYKSIRHTLTLILDGLQLMNEDHSWLMKQSNNMMVERYVFQWHPSLNIIINYISSIYEAWMI